MTKQEMIDILMGKVRFGSSEECQEKLNEIADWISKAELKGGENNDPEGIA